VTIDLDVKNRAESQISTKTVLLDPNYHPLVQTTAGLIPASTRRELTHELGHVMMGEYDNGPDAMNNVNRNENPIMEALGEPRRTQYYRPK
jgi:hypothetical protein